MKLYIVAQKLDSDDPNFPQLVMMHGMIDEQNSERMRHRVLRGQEGRVRQGFASGSRCFGYRSVPVGDPTRPDLQGRAATLGCKWVIIESEAATIRRIYELYANGLSDFRIVLKLNQGGGSMLPGSPGSARTVHFGTRTWSSASFKTKSTLAS